MKYGEINKLVKSKKSIEPFADFCFKNSCEKCAIKKIKENFKTKEIKCFSVYNNIEKYFKSNIYNY